MSVNREHKDSLFTALFADPKRLISLYNALSGSRLPVKTSVELTTLMNVLFHGLCDDIAFLIEDKLVVLMEHQSSVNANMPLRVLVYLARMYEKIIDKRLIYQQKLVKIPKPEFIVLYNGIDEQPDEQTLRLSDAFKNPPATAAAAGLGGLLELEIRVLNINEGRNEAIVNRCEALSGYMRFVGMIRRNLKTGADLEESVVMAINECIREGILAEFLELHASEVFNMLTLEFNMEDAKVYWREEGREVGREEERDTIKKIVAALKKGILPDEIARSMKVPAENILQWKEILEL